MYGCAFALSVHCCLVMSLHVVSQLWGFPRIPAICSVADFLSCFPPFFLLLSCSHVTHPCLCSCCAGCFQRLSVRLFVFPCACCSLILPSGPVCLVSCTVNPHTHTHTHTPTHTYTGKRPLTLTQTDHTVTHTYSLSLSLPLSCTATPPTSL